MSAALVAKYVAALVKAGSNTQAVSAIVAGMKADKSLKAAGVKAVAKQFMGGGKAAKSAKEAFGSIVTRGAELARGKQQLSVAASSRPLGIALGAGTAAAAAGGIGGTSEASASELKPRPPPSPKPAAASSGSDLFSGATAIAIGSGMMMIPGPGIGGKVFRYGVGPALIAAGGLVLSGGSAKAESAKPVEAPKPSATPSTADSKFKANVAFGMAQTMIGASSSAIGGHLIGSAIVSAASGRGSQVAAVLKGGAGVGSVVAGGLTTFFGVSRIMGDASAKAETAKQPKPSAAPASSKQGAVWDSAGRIADVGFTSVMTAHAARLMASPAARIGATVLSKAAVPLTIAQAAYGAYQGYQKSGVSGIALGAADGVTGGGVSMALSYLNSSAATKAAAAPARVKAPAAQAAPAAAGSGGGGMKSYTTADGRSVQGTAAQIASWEGRKK